MTGTSAWELLELASAELQSRALSASRVADAGAALQALAGLMADPSGFRDPADVGRAADLEKAVAIAASMTSRLGGPGRAHQLVAAAADVVRTSPVPTAAQKQSLMGKLAATAADGVDALAAAAAAADRVDLSGLGPGRLGLPASADLMRETLAALPAEPAYRDPDAAWLHRTVAQRADLAGTAGPAAAIRGLADALRESTAHRDVTMLDLKMAVRSALVVLATASGNPAVVGDAAEKAMEAARAFRAIGAQMYRTVDGASPDVAVRQAVDEVDAELPAMDAASFALASRELPYLAEAVREALDLHASGFQPSPAGGSSVLLMARTPMGNEHWALMRLNDRSLTRVSPPLIPLPIAARAELAAAGGRSVAASRELRDHLNPPRIVGLDRALAATARHQPTPPDVRDPGIGRPIDGPSR